MKKIYFSYIFLFLVLNFTFTKIIFAQDLSIRQFPESPREGEEVKLSLESDKYNLNIANITWSLEGQIIDSGVGRKTLTIKAPTDGLAQVIIAKVEQEGFNSDEIEKIIEANTNFILYEGVDSYVPGFYKGRRLPAKEGVVRAAVFSFRDGGILGLDNSDTENYIWTINGQDKLDLSGNNRIINEIQSRITDNSVDIKVIKEDMRANKKLSQVVVPLQKTEIIIYKTESNKLTKQIISNTEIGKEIYLSIEPFYFSVPDKRSTNLLYTWRINDIDTKTATPWSVRFTGNPNESFQLNLSVINNKKITQENNRGFTFKVK